MSSCRTVDGINFASHTRLWSTARAPAHHPPPPPCFNVVFGLGSAPDTPGRRFEWKKFRKSDSNIPRPSLSSGGDSGGMYTFEVSAECLGRGHRPIPTDDIPACEIYSVNCLALTMMKPFQCLRQHWYPGRLAFLCNGEAPTHVFRREEPCAPAPL